MRIIENCAMKTFHPRREFGSHSFFALSRRLADGDVPFNTCRYITCEIALGCRGKVTVSIDPDTRLFHPMEWRRDMECQL